MIPNVVRALPSFTMIAHIRPRPPLLVEPVVVHFAGPMPDGGYGRETWFWWSDDARFRDYQHNGYPRIILCEDDVLREIRVHIGPVISWEHEAAAQAIERDRFCIDAARKTIAEVRDMVGARYDEATTDAVARALRRGAGDGEVAVVIRVPLKPPTYDAAELAEMTDEEVLGVFREDPHSAIFGDDATWTVDRGPTRQEGSDG